MSEKSISPTPSDDSVSLSVPESKGDEVGELGWPQRAVEEAGAAAISPVQAEPQLDPWARSRAAPSAVAPVPWSARRACCSSGLVSDQMLAWNASEFGGLTRFAKSV